jgi:hypothetical protein
MIRGVAICPYGTDRNTSAYVLNEKEGRVMEKNTPTKEPAKEPKKPELENFIQAFGLEQGVQYYRDGVNFEDAQKKDYAALKEWKAAKLKEKEAAIANEPANANDAIKNELQQLREKCVALESLIPRGEPTPVSQTEEQHGEPKDERPAYLKMREKLAKQAGF